MTRFAVRAGPDESRSDESQDARSEDDSDQPFAFAIA